VSETESPDTRRFYAGLRAAEPAGIVSSSLAVTVSKQIALSDAAIRRKVALWIMGLLQR
jgi:hypothetical protein